MKNLNMNIKKFILALLAISLLSCKSDNDEKTIRILGENSSNLQALESLKADYEKMNGYKIIFYPNSYEDSFNKANQDFVNKTGIYDIVLQYNFSLSSFVKNKYIVPLSTLREELSDSLRSFESDLFPNVWKEVGFYYEENDKTVFQQVGYPFAANTMLIAYNRDLFEDSSNKDAYRKKYGRELTPPTDWAQYRQLAEFFTQPSKGIVGVSIAGATGGWLYYEFCNYLLGYGETVMNKKYGWEGNSSTQLNLTSEKAIAATEYYLSLKPYSSTSYDKIDASDQINSLINGKVAMGIIWSDYAYNLIYNQEGALDNRFGFAPIPGNKSIIAGGSFFVNINSKNKTESIKYIANLLQRDNQIQLFKKGLCSPVQSVYEDEEVKKIPYTNSLYQSLKQGVYALEAGPDANLISDKITEYIQQAWSGKLTAREALSKAQEEIMKERSDYFK
jgi:multiple sugar transport system substrate-binding protein